MTKIQLSDHFTYGKLFRFTIPSIAMMVFTSIYYVVDGYFVSNYAGKTSFAAINLIMPFIMILSGLGFMIGTGGSALISFLLGSGDKKKANRTFSLLIYFTIILGIIISIIGFFIVEPVAIAFGATEAMLPECVLYGRICILFNVTFMLQNAFQSFFVVAEKPRMGFIVTLAAGFTNIILDYVFVGRIGMGVAGAAWATILSQTVGGGIPLVYFFLPNKSPLRLGAASLDVSAITKTVSNGCSELMSNIASSIIGIIYNWQLLKFAGENGVAAYGVIMYVAYIFIAIFVGYSIGSAPIVGYHYGAGNNKELKNMRKKSLKIVGIFGLVMAGLAWIFAPALANIFVGYDNELLAMTVNAFRLYSLCYIFGGFNIYASSFFTALGNGPVSAAISFLRVLVFQMLAVLLLPIILGINGIWIANTLAEIGALIITATFLIKLQKKYNY